MSFNFAPLNSPGHTASHSEKYTNTVKSSTLVNLALSYSQILDFFVVTMTKKNVITTTTGHNVMKPFVAVIYKCSQLARVSDPRKSLA